MARRRWLGMVAVMDTRAFFGGEGYRRMTVAETMSASPSRGEEWFFLTSKGWDKDPQSVGQLFF